MIALVLESDRDNKPNTAIDRVSSYILEIGMRAIEAACWVLAFVGTTSAFAIDPYKPASFSDVVEGATGPGGICLAVCCAVHSLFSKPAAPFRAVVTESVSMAFAIALKDILAILVFQ